MTWKQILITFGWKEREREEQNATSYYTPAGGAGGPLRVTKKYGRKPSLEMQLVPEIIGTPLGDLAFKKGFSH